MNIEDKELFLRIKNDIIDRLQKINYTGHLDDLGNEIGIIVGRNICKNGKQLNIDGFEKDDFIIGFEHGYSLKDGSH